MSTRHQRIFKNNLNFKRAPLNFGIPGDKTTSAATLIG